MSQRSRYALNKNKYLLDPEVDRLERLLKDHLPKDPRNCTLLLLALHTGARASELLLTTEADLNEHDESIFLRGLKGSNDRELPLAPWLFGQAKRLVTAAPTNDQLSPKLFSITYNRLWQIWENYRPVPKKFHALRHTFAIRLYKKTRDLRLVQFALGHRNITNTMIYADYAYSQQELRKLIL